jgi:hypothetical protein
MGQLIAYKAKAPLSKVAEVVKLHMEKLAGLDESIGPPYHYLTITAKALLQYNPSLGSSPRVKPRCLPLPRQGGIFSPGQSH